MKLHNRSPLPSHRTQQQNDVKILSGVEARDNSNGKNHNRRLYNTFVSYWWRIRTEPVRFSMLSCLLIFFIVLFHAAEEEMFLHPPRVLHIDTIYDNTAALPKHHILSKLSSRKDHDFKDLVFKRSKHDKRRGHYASDGDNEYWYDRYRFIPQDEEMGCPFVADWQKRSAGYPTCNTLHELGTTIDIHQEGESHIEHIANGGYNDVWKVFLEGNTEPANFVLKTSVWKRDYTESDLYDHSIDALIMEQTTSSPYILNMYAYCGKANIVESASQTLGNWARKNIRQLKSIELLRLAYQVAQGVADMHLFYNNTATFAHADIKVSQFLQVPDTTTFKINDFNRGRLLTSKNPPEICPFTMSNHHKGSTNRSPEEYTDNGPQTDKIDVFALGSILYYLLAGKTPFAGVEYNLAMQHIRDGIHPPLQKRKEFLEDPSIKIIVNAMNWCWKHDRFERPRSFEVADLLKKALLELDG